MFQAEAETQAEVPEIPEVLLQTEIIAEPVFIQMIRFERRRTERSGRQFMLVLVTCERFGSRSEATLLKDVVIALTSNTRETDLLGWYEDGATLGLLMTEIGEVNSETINIIQRKILQGVRRVVGVKQFELFSFQFRLFPQELEKPSDRDGNQVYFPDVEKPMKGGAVSNLIIKRGIDLIGSLLALIVFLPVFAVIAMIVKLSSPGPILFSQKRVGRYGREFNFYKFRTMYSNNDPSIHKEYVSKLIAGSLDAKDGVYKISNDPRVTRFGRFLRRTSLDELPQFVNVLKNDMSLVGPRPPLPYEFERYKTWHKRRVLELKPGLTGPWQIAGRSRTTFDEMVRMDLRYALDRSLWRDIKILLQTPIAMFSGRGAC
jgi:lipopolysaccharide/colanic/teichoic acid biosynthesis glycosyltransferase